MTTPIQSNKSVELPLSTISVWVKCPFLRLIQKVWNAVKSLFYAIKNFIFPPKYKQLGARDIEILQRAKRDVRLSRHGSPAVSSNDLNSRNISNHTTSTIHLNDVENSNDGKVQKNVLDDPAYNGFYEVGLNFIHEASEIVYEDLIIPEIPKLQKQIGNLQSFLIKGADIAISLGSKLTSPLDDKLKKFIPTDIIEDDMKKLLEWLVGDSKYKESDAQNEISEKIFNKLDQRIDEDRLDDAIKICSQWLFETDHDEPLLNQKLQFQYQSVLELVFKEFIVTLSEHKIQDFDAKVQEKLNENLIEIIHSMLVTNGDNLGKIVLERFIRVIDHVQFPNMMDDVLRLFVNHSSAVNKSEKIKHEEINNERKRIQNNRTASQETKVQNDQQQENLRLQNIQIFEQTQKEMKELWIKIRSKKSRDLAIKSAKVRLKTYNDLVKDAKENSTVDELRDILSDIIGQLGFDPTQIHPLRVQEWLHNIGEQAKIDRISELNEKYDRIYSSEDDELIRKFEKKLLDLWLEGIGADTASQVYKNFLVEDSTLCHPKIDELELVESTSVFKKSIQKTREESEEFDLVTFINRLVEIAPVILNLEKNQSKTLFDDTADRLLSLLFPDIPVQLSDDLNKTDKIDGLVNLFNQFEYPQALKELFQEAEYIYQEVLTDERQKDIIDLLHPNSPLTQIIESWFLRYAKHMMKNGIAQTISSLFQKFIVSDKIDQLFASTVLPNIQMSIVSSILSSVIEANSKIYADNFVKIIKAASDDERDQQIHVLTNELNNELRSHLHLSNDAENNNEENGSYDLDENKLNLLIVKQIEELATTIDKVINEENLDDSSINNLFVSENIQEYFINYAPETNLLYKDLVNNLVFEMGEFGGVAGGIKGLYLKRIAKEITQSSYDIQNSPHFLLNKATEYIAESLSNPEQVRDFIFGEPREIDQKIINKKLQDELTKTAKIGHDYLTIIVEQQSFFIRKGAQWFVMPSDYSRLDRAIKRIYEKLFGNPVYTQNLSVRMQEIISNALQEGAKVLASQNSTVPKMDHVPSLMSSLLSNLSDKTLQEY